MAYFKILKQWFYLVILLSIFNPTIFPLISHLMTSSILSLNQVYSNDTVLFVISLTLHVSLKSEPNTSFFPEYLQMLESKVIVLHVSRMSLFSFVACHILQLIATTQIWAANSSMRKGSTVFIQLSSVKNLKSSGIAKYHWNTSQIFTSESADFFKKASQLTNLNSKCCKRILSRSESDMAS